MYFSPESSLSTCGQRILSPFEHNIASCAQTPRSHHYLGGHTRSEEAAQRRIFLQFGSLDKTPVRGRWQSTRTARLYVDEGVAALASIVSTPAQERHIRSLAASVATCTDALSVIARSLAQGQSELRRSGVSEALRRPQSSPWIQEKSQRRAAGTRAHGDTVHHESPSSVSRK